MVIMPKLIRRITVDLHLIFYILKHTNGWRKNKMEYKQKKKKKKPNYISKE